MEKQFQYHVIKISKNKYFVSCETGGKNIVLTTSLKNAKKFAFYAVCANTAIWVGGDIETIYK